MKRLKKEAEESEEDAEELATAISLSLVGQTSDDQHSTDAKVKALISKEEEAEPLTVHYHTSEETPPQTNISSLLAFQSHTNISPLTSPGSPSLFAGGVQQFSG